MEYTLVQVGVGDTRKLDWWRSDANMGFSDGSNGLEEWRTGAGRL